MSFLYGILAALAAPLVMTIGFVMWEDWKGSAFALNMFKCSTASIGFLVLSAATTTPPFASYEGNSVGFLILSATIGILIGDWMWLKGQKILGSIRVIFIDSLKPFLAALLGWLILGEEIRPAAFGGIVLTVLGVLLVSYEYTMKSEEDQVRGCDDNSRGSMQQEEHSTATIHNDGETAHETMLKLEEGDASSMDPKEDSLTTPDATATATATATTVATDESEDPVPKASDAQLNKRQKRIRSPREIRIGYIYAILNVALDTYGAVLIKQFGQQLTVWEINLVRFGFAGAFLLSVSAAFHAHTLLKSIEQRQKGSETSNGDKKDKDKAPQQQDSETSDGDKKDGVPWYALPLRPMTRTNWIYVSVGVALVTFLTPSLSNYALFQLAIALSLTLTSISPLYSIPVKYVMHKEIPTLRACLGALLAVGGIVVLAFRGTPPSES